MAEKGNSDVSLFITAAFYEGGSSRPYGGSSRSRSDGGGSRPDLTRNGADVGTTSTSSAVVESGSDEKADIGVALLATIY